MQISGIAGWGAAGVNDDYFGAMGLLCLNQPLEKNRMTPCRIGADQNHKTSLIPVLIITGHCVTAKGALMACYG